MTSLVKDAEWPAWFSPIREAVTLLKSCYARELPTAVLMRDFLPACQENWSVVLQSPHPFDGQSVRETVHIPHADALTVRFHTSTSMGERDVIVVKGGKDSDSDSGSGGNVFHHEYVNMSSGTDLVDAAPNSITVGDKVVRGPAWDCGNQDGGAGSFGEVMSVSK
jgi:hypothetical protein